MIKSKEELNNLTDADWMKGVQFNLSKELLGPNEHRNIESYPILKERVKSLIESIKSSKTEDNIESGLWWGQEGAIYGTPDISKIEFDEDGICTAFPFTTDESHLPEGSRFPVRRPSGHHRHEACVQLNFRFHPVTIRPITKRVRLVMMVNENNSTYGNHPRAQMESIKQVKITSEEYAAEFDTFEECNSVYPGIFASKKAWSYVRTNGAGKSVIQRFLGGSWTEKDVSLYLRMNTNVEKGYYTDDEMARIGNKSVIDEYGRLIEAVSNQQWPVPFIDEMAKELKRNITDTKNIVTVKSLTEARKNLKNGYNPYTYLAGGTLVTFDITKNLVQVLKKGIEVAKEEGAEYDPQVLLTQGYVGFETQLGEAWEMIFPTAAEGVDPSDPSVGSPTKTDGEVGALGEAEQAAADAMSETDIPGVNQGVLDAVTESAKVDDDTRFNKEFIDALINLDVAITHCLESGITYIKGDEVHEAIVKSWNGVAAKAVDFFGPDVDDGEGDLE